MLCSPRKRRPDTQARTMKMKDATLSNLAAIIAASEISPEEFEAALDARIAEVQAAIESIEARKRRAFFLEPANPTLH
jgi:hypothetical protein